MKNNLKISVSSKACSKAFGLDDFINKLQDIIAETKKAETPPKKKPHKWRTNSVNSKAFGEDWDDTVQEIPVETKKTETQKVEIEKYKWIINIQQRHEEVPIWRRQHQLETDNVNIKVFVNNWNDEVQKIPVETKKAETPPEKKPHKWRTDSVNSKAFDDDWDDNIEEGAKFKGFLIGIVASIYFIIWFIIPDLMVGFSCLAVPAIFIFVLIKIIFGGIKEE
jgi:hypothetical protein